MRNNKENLMKYLNDFINAPEEISRYGCEISVEEARIILDLQQRIDKTIEYIEEIMPSLRLSNQMYSYIKKHLLEILKGDSNE